MSEASNLRKLTFTTIFATLCQACKGLRIYRVIIARNLQLLQLCARYKLQPPDSVILVIEHVKGIGTLEQQQAERAGDVALSHWEQPGSPIEAKRRWTKKRIAVIVLLAATIGQSPVRTAEPDVRRDTAVQAVERVMPSVVNIGTETIVE